MNAHSKLKLFRALTENQSLANLRERAGDKVDELILSIDAACIQQDSENLLRCIGRYLQLNSVSPRAISFEPVQFGSEDFASIIEILTPILDEIKIGTKK